MRLDKFLSHATGYSRAQVKKLLRDKRVSVGGVLMKQADHDVGEQDTVLLDNEPVSIAGTLYLMLHKPAGYVCANTDSEFPTIMDLMADVPSDLPIAGRLDKDTTGLVLLSSDGQWVHRIISPRSDCHKTYHAVLDKPIDDDIVAKFAEGIRLKGEDKLTRPAQLLRLDNKNKVSVTISEGRYHQVKRMFAASGCHVLALHRVSIGSIVLDPALEPGHYRELTDEEVSSIGVREVP